jgi:hypothetical protein
MGMEYNETQLKRLAEEFQKEDPKHSGYSMLEYDVYSNWGPATISDRTAAYRETIRKNLKEDKYEVFRHHFFKSVPSDRYIEEGWDEVVFSSPSLEEALEYGDKDAKAVLHNPDQNQGPGRCRRCHRKLTKPESIARGYGDACWAKVTKGV